MQRSILNWSIAGAALAITLAIGFWVSKRASANSASYCLARRNMSWWSRLIPGMRATFGYTNFFAPTHYKRQGDLGA